MSLSPTEPLAVRDAPHLPPRRPRVLLMSYACSPEQGSEPGVGWNRAVQTARYCDTWLICEMRRYGPPVQRYLDKHGTIPGLEFVFVPRVPGPRRLWTLSGLDYLSYNLWQRRAYRAARQLHRRIRFDLVHQLTFCGYREPGYLWRLGPPFVWGPVGGTQNYPWRFLGLSDPVGGLREALRNVVNTIQLHFSPRVRQAARAAAALLAANSTVQHDVERACRVRPLLQLETGVAAVNGQPRIQSGSPGVLRVLWSGELRCYKALPLLLHAVARLPPDVRYELRVLGTGPLARRWRRFSAERLGVAGRTQWLGWLPFADALRQYEFADVLAFTSLRDTSGNVVLEALACGVPVVCLDHQGVRDIVTPACGVKVPVTRPAAVIDGLADALTRLARDPLLRQELEKGALARAQDFLWSRQAERMAAVYADALKVS